MRGGRDPQIEGVQMAGECVSEVSRPPGLEMSGRELLQKWLNKSMRIQMTDGRVLVGIFVCTDQDRNVILGSSHEYLSPPENSTTEKEEPRVLGLAMVPGHHIVSIHIDEEAQDSEQNHMAKNTAQSSEEKTDNTENSVVSSGDTTDVSLKRVEDTKVDSLTDDSSEPACSDVQLDQGSGQEKEDSSTIQNKESLTTKDSLTEDTGKDAAET